MGQSRNYTPEEVDKGLIALLALGNSNRAAHYLREQGIEITAQLLRDWKTRVHVDRYVELAGQYQDKQAAIIATENEEVARYTTSLEMKTLGLIEQAIDGPSTESEGLKPADLAALSNTLRNLSVTKGISVDKIASPLRGRPTSVVEHRSLDEIKRRWEARGLIDGTADEIPHPQLSTVSHTPNVPEPVE